MTFTDEYYMNLALAEAQAAAAEDEIPIGAIVVGPNGRILGRGHNQTERLGDVTAHAEMLAISAAAQTLGGKYLAGCTLYVTVEPCPMCAGAIVQARIPRVVIGSMNPKAGCAGSVMNILQTPGFNHQAELVCGVLEEECSRLMTSFFRELRLKKK